MLFSYTKLNKPDARGVMYAPLLNIKVSYRGKNWPTIALVDSGASSILVNAGLADVWHIDLKTCRRSQTIGVGGGQNVWLFDDLNFEFLGISSQVIKLPIEFIRSPSVNVLLGQRGFFENFDVTFYRNRLQFDITQAQPLTVLNKNLSK